MTTEIIASEANLVPRIAVPLDMLREQIKELDAFKRDIMRDGEDYGVIPGTPKPTLLKPGAEKLALAFGLAPRFRTVNKIEDWENGFFHYEVDCRLISKRTRECVANGIGSANTREPRYRWRTSKPTCPGCGSELRRSKQAAEWYCWAKQGGCGKTFPLSQVDPGGRTENPEPYELVNTVLKMAQKRALVAAVLIATGGSGIWTQDLEDSEVVPSPASESDERDQPAPNYRAAARTTVQNARQERYGQQPDGGERMTLQEALAAEAAKALRGQNASVTECSGLYRRIVTFEQGLVSKELCKPKDLLNHLIATLSAEIPGIITDWPDSATDKVTAACKQFEAKCPIATHHQQELADLLAVKGETPARLFTALGKPPGSNLRSLTFSEWRRTMKSLKDLPDAEDNNG